MRNAKSKLLVLLGTLLAVGMGYMAAYQINVGPQNYFGTLTLNKLYIMKGDNITGIVIDGSGYEISIASGRGEGLGKLSVYRICEQGGGNCKKVSQLSTGGGTTEITGGNGKICLKSGNSLNCNTVSLGTATNDFTGNGYCIFSGNKIVCNASGGSYDGIAITTGSEGGYCKYVKDETINGLYGALDSSGHVECTDDGGVGLWSTNVEYGIHPNGKDLYLNNSNNNNINYNGKLYFKSIARGGSASAVIHENGARFGNIGQVRIMSFPGVSIAGELVIGNSGANNYIYIYSTGDAGGNSRHYEIKAKKELAIGVDSGAFMFFNHCCPVKAG